MSSSRNQRHVGWCILYNHAPILQRWQWKVPAIYWEWVTIMFVQPCISHHRVSFQAKIVCLIFEVMSRGERVGVTLWWVHRRCEAIGLWRTAWCPRNTSSPLSTPSSLSKKHLRIGSWQDWPFRLRWLSWLTSTVLRRRRWEIACIIKSLHR